MKTPLSTTPAAVLHVTPTVPIPDMLMQSHVCPSSGSDPEEHRGAASRAVASG